MDNVSPLNGLIPLNREIEIQANQTIQKIKLAGTTDNFFLFLFPFPLFLFSKNMSQSWSPSSWKSKPIVQDVVYESPEQFDNVLNKLNRLPPLVSATEVRINPKETMLIQIRLKT